MSIVPYNTNNRILYHDPNHGFLVLHNNQQNTIQLLSTADNNQTGKRKDNNKSNDESFDSSSFAGSSGVKCPNCGFSWEYNRRTTDNGVLNHGVDIDTTSALTRQLPGGFMHHDYFKLLSKLPLNNEQNPKPQNSYSLPEDIFNPGYFKRFFKKVPPYTLGSGAHAQVYKVIHVLNDIQLGTYAVKRITIGDKFELLEQVLNEVLILYELSVKGANENNLIRYNHVWVELGDIMDSSTFFFPESNNLQPDTSTKVPYVYILQQFCGGGHLEDLIIKNFQKDKHSSIKEKVELERRKRRASRGLGFDQVEYSKKWLTNFEIWKFFRDIANGVNYLHTRGILHRDLKPSNCLLDVAYDTSVIHGTTYSSVHHFEQDVLKLPKVLVSDFGEGKFINKQHPRNRNFPKFDKEERQGNTGTLEFTAPELWFSNYDPSSGESVQSFLKNFSFESDIYSLGVILCYLCVGELPFTSKIQNEMDPQIIREKIIKWYMSLDASSFRHWFVEASNKARQSPTFDSNILKFEELIYVMIKGKQSEENGPFQRIGSVEVLAYLDDIKWSILIPNGDPEHEFTEFKFADKAANDQPYITSDALIDSDVSDLSEENLLNLVADVSANHTPDKPADILIDKSPTISSSATTRFYIAYLLLIELISYHYWSVPLLSLKIVLLSSLFLDSYVMYDTNHRFSILIAITAVSLFIVIYSILLKVNL
ncbi:kinase-like domain-containing protein [Scheffersomyces coipomensis]|uniref:kinase-like domain-containing protein n=1 Tax=Scheffersomyces coipomensis TaxID=1788519 RepID=UPI00315D6F67